MTKSPKIPWPRILAEGVAIVVSILLAFGIEAWWSNREVRLNVQENLIALRDELGSNLREIEYELSYRHAVIASIEKLSSSDGSASSLTPEEIDKLIGDITWYGRADVSMGALESALQSDVFTEIEDRELQRHIAALPTLYGHVEQFELRDTEFTLNRLYTYIYTNGSLNQIFNSESSGRPGTGESSAGNQFREFRVITERDHSQFLELDEFLGMLTTAHGSHSDIVMMYKRLQAKIEDTIASIERKVP